jgi:hypothetical protein
MQCSGRLHASAALTQVTSSIPAEQEAGWAPDRSLFTLLTELPRLPQQIVKTLHIPQLKYYVTVYIATRLGLLLYDFLDSFVVAQQRRKMLKTLNKFCVFYSYSTFCCFFLTARFEIVTGSRPSTVRTKNFATRCEWPEQGTWSEGGADETLTVTSHDPPEQTNGSLGD